MDVAEIFIVPVADFHWQSILDCGPAALSMVSLESISVHEGGNYLTEEENLRLSTFSFAKRRQEWLGGRLAAKYAAARLAYPSNDGHASRGVDWRGWNISANKQGRPFLDRLPKDCEGRIADISITHSSGLAAAMAVRRGLCGIDLQKVSDRTLKIRERFCSGHEQKIVLAAAAHPPEQLTLLWAAKEAIRKAAASTTLPGFLDIHLSSLSTIEQESWRQLDFTDARAKKHRVAATLRNGFALAVTHRKDM